MIKAIIVDDELPSIHIIKKYLLETNKVDVVGSFQRAKDSLEFIISSRVDVIFLDIEMPNMSGLQLTEHINKLDYECRIVYITAYNKYAVKAFEQDALDYLLKPIEPKRLSITIDRIYKSMNLSDCNDRINIKCFGKFQVSINNRPIKFRTRKSEELLALLIDANGRYVPRSKCIDILWGEFDGDKAHVNLNTTLYNIRKALRSYGYGDLVKYERESYIIDTTLLDCDYYKLVNYNIDVSDSIDKIESILSLYTDEYLIANDYIWTSKTRLNMHDKYISIALKLSKMYYNNGSIDRAITTLKNVFEKDSTNSCIAYDLVDYLYKQRRYKVAKGYFDRYKSAIHNLGMKPTKDFLKLIKNQES